MTQHTTDFLIIGNSAAGISAAETIRQYRPEASILMLSNEPYPAYGRPLISYLLEGKSTEDSIWLRDADFYQRMSIDTLFGPDYAVVSLDAHAHAVTLGNGDTVAYGQCLVATGSYPFVPPCPGLEQQENVFTFTTLDQAKAAGEEAKAVTEAAHAEGRRSRVLVSGAGLIGVKAAEALSFLVDDILVVEPAPRVLMAVLDEHAIPIVLKEMETQDIICRTGVMAAEYVSESNRLIGARLTDATFVECDMVIMAAGVRPNSAFVVEAGAEQGRGLVVDENQRTTLPDVYAAGDVVQMENMLDGSLAPLAMWPNAIRQARIAALAMMGETARPDEKGNYAVNATNIFEVSILSCGLSNPPADGGYEEKVYADGDSYAKFVVKDGRLYGYALVNRPENAGMYTNLIAHATPLSEFTEDIFERPIENSDYTGDDRWNRLHKHYPSGLDRRGWKEA